MKKDELIAMLEPFRDECEIGFKPAIARHDITGYDYRLEEGNAKVYLTGPKEGGEEE